jgi:chemotaxis protein CheD
LSQARRISIGDLRVAKAPAVLIAYGLGSCLAIVLYEPITRLGGLAHALLPMAPAEPTDKQGKYVDASIHAMVAQMETLGAQRQHLRARLFGGAQMFRPIQSAEESVGQRNLHTAQKVLSALRIPLTDQDVGGNSGRTVEFDLSDGSVMVRSLFNDGKLVRFSFSANQESP